MSLVARLYFRGYFVKKAHVFDWLMPTTNRLGQSNAYFINSLMSLEH